MLHSLRSRSAEETCRCRPSFAEPGGTGVEDRVELRIDADDCPGDGDLAGEPTCRATAVDALADRDADAVRVRSGGYERWYADEVIGLLHAAGRFAALAAHHDVEIAATARTDPLAAAHEATGRSGPVGRLAAETGLAEGATRVDDEREARRELATITGTLSNTAALFAPLVGGVSVAMVGRLPADTGGSLAGTTAGAGASTASAASTTAGTATLEVASLGPVIGLYVLLIAAILTGLATALERGLDRSLLGYRIGLALPTATGAYVASVVAAEAVL